MIQLECIMMCSFFIIQVHFVISEFNFDHFTLENGKEISAGNNLLLSRKVSSKLACARLCVEDSSCSITSFNSGSKVCQLYNDSNLPLQPSVMGVVLKKDHASCVPNNYQPIDCTDLPTTCPSDVYHVFPPNSPMGIHVYCEIGGWMVVQKRQDGSIDFFRDWVSYKTGFGDVTGEYWMGNEYLYEYTNSRPYILRIEVEDFHGEQRWAEYNTFLVGAESTNYTLTVAGYSGTTGDLMDYSNGRQFTTTDKDHDTWTSGACTDLRGGCFWYGYCTFTNLNGRYYNLSTVGSASDSIFVWPWKSGTGDPMKKTVMMIK